MRLETALDFSAHAARLGPSYAEWRRSALQGSFAKYLDRKKKRFFTGGRAALELLTKPDEINTAIAAIQSLRQGRFAGDMIATDFVRDFTHASRRRERAKAWRAPTACRSTARASVMSSV